MYYHVNLTLLATCACFVFLSYRKHSALNRYSLGDFETISTSLPKIHTFPYCNSEFHTIHYIEKLKVEYHIFLGIPYCVRTL